MNIKVKCESQKYMYLNSYIFTLKNVWMLQNAYILIPFIFTCNKKRFYHKNINNWMHDNKKNIKHTHCKYTEKNKTAN